MDSKDRVSDIKGLEAFSESVIETKLRPPPVVSVAVERTRELEKLCEAAKKGHVATIVAPAGSGKSTLLTQHFDQLEANGISSHWVSLDGTNDEPVDFVRHLLQSLESLAPAVVESQLTQLRSSFSDDAQAAFELLTRFVASRSQPIAIFLDDFHLISSAEIHAAIGRLLSYLPSNVHFVLASRSRIAVDLSRRRLSGMLIEITAEDMNLNPAETERFLSDVHGLNLQHSDLDRLHAVTEGWLAGVQLAALRIKQTPNEARLIIQEFSEHDQNLKDYLFRSVFDQLSDAARAFLLATSPLRKMNASLCDVVLGQSNSAELLEEIERRNLFLIPLDKRRQWFRYHHLLSDFLLQEFHRTKPDGPKQIRDVAAQWCESHGMLTDAIQYLLDAESFDDAAELINTNVSSIALEDGDHSTVLDWMRRLPPSIHDNSPQLLLNHAWSRAFSRDVDKARALCDRAMELLNDESFAPEMAEEEREGLIWYARVLDGLSIAALDRTRSAVETNETLIHRLPKNELVLRATVANILSYCHLANGDLQQVMRDSAQAYRFGQSGETAYSVVWSQFLAGVCNIELGRLGAAEEAAKLATQYLETTRPDGLYTRALIQLLHAEIAIQRCDFCHANELISNGNIFSTFYGPTDVLVRAYSAAARQLAWRGTMGQARQELLHAQDIALATNQQRMYLMLAYEEVMLQFQCGDVEAARDTVRRTDFLALELDENSKENQQSVQDARRIIEARFLMAENQSLQAQKLLFGLVRRAENDGHIWKLAQLRTLRSVAMWQEGKNMDAVREFMRAINLVGTEGILYPLVSAGAALLPVLGSIEEQWENVEPVESSQAYKRELIARLRAVLEGDTSKFSLDSSSQGHSAATVSTNYELTNREIELLTLIASGLSNKELAAEAFITVSTAKWHMQNIFEKLGVRNRIAAVAAARKAQLIP